MTNSRSQFVANFINRFIRAISRRTNFIFNQTNEQLQNNNSRIEKLNKNEQFFERRDEIVQNVDDQIIDNSRNIHENDVDDDEKFNIDRQNDIASQNVDFDIDEKTFQKKSCISSHTLSNNVVDTSINNRFRRNFVNKNEFEKLQMRFLKSKNEILKFRLNNVEKNMNDINHRREHNDDHYRRNVKRTNRFEKFKMQIVINYNNLIN